MNKKQLLVAGIDPGTTAGFCLLDLNGRLVTLQSSKQLTLDKIIAKSVDFGKVIIVGTDKRNVPDFVAKYATQFRAKMTAPDHDLTTEEKRIIVGSRKSVGSHEFDSLASALFALSEFSALIRKVRLMLKTQKKEELFSQVAEIVIKQGIAVKLAYDMVTRPKEEAVRVATKAIEEETVTKQRVQCLYEELGNRKEAGEVLKRQNEELARELKRQQSLVDYLNRKMGRISIDDKAEEVVRRREEQISGLHHQMQAMISEISELKSELAKQRNLIVELSDKVLAKKLKNLGQQEFDKKSQYLKIKRFDILLVDDPAVYSESILEKIRRLEIMLLLRKKMPEKLLKGILYADASRLQMVESRYFAAVDKKSFEKLRADKEMLKRVVKDYQDSRS